MKILSDEVKNLTSKWKESEISCRQLFVELEENRQNHQIVLAELNEAKILLNNTELEKTNLYEKNESFEKERKKLESTIEKLKLDLKKERMRQDLEHLSYLQNRRLHLPICVI